MLMVRKIVLSIVAVLALSFSALAQNQQVTGTVVDSAGAPIVGATVFVDGTNIGVTTNLDGDFGLQAPANGTLLVSFIGYEAQRIEIAGKTVINVVLKENLQAIDEVVVQTFGEVKKKDMTGSVAAVTAKDLQKMTVSTVTKALEGAVPGIQSYSSTGQPGTDASILIRGVGSINGNTGALIVVDGVPYSSSLTTINPLDIESVVVSKDAAANALYGARAANGVVFVTTKKGARNSKANITFEGKWGWNEIGVEEHHTMNPAQYIEHFYLGLYNYGLDAYGDAASATSLAQRNLYSMLGLGGYGYMPYTIPEENTAAGYKSPIDSATGRIHKDAKLLYYDNYDDYLFTQQFRQEYTLSVSGGNDRVDYYVSGGFLEDPSYIIKSSFKRFSARAAVNAQVTKWMKLGTNIAYTRRDTDNPGFGDGANTGNAFLWTAWQSPLVPYYARDPQGNIIKDENGKKVYEDGYGSTMTQFGPAVDQFNNMNGTHPYLSFTHDINNNVRDNLFANAYVDITFLKDFKFTANITLDNVYAASTYYSNNEYGSAADPSWNGIVEKVMNNYMSLNTQQMLSYHKKINKIHVVDAMIGHEFSKDEDVTVDAYKKNVFYPGIPELGNAITPLEDGSTSSTVKTAIEGYFARANYTYDDRYTVSASYRYDGTSMFKYDKWGHFWSVGAAWKINNEQFMDNAHWVNDLRLRVTYGVSGNRLSSAYPYTNLWGIGELNGQPTISQSTTGNRNLSWEKNKQVDVGVDFRLWDRVYGTLDYYNRRTHDLIWSRPTPSSTGLSSRLENVGVLENSGFEFDVTVDLIKTKNVYWNVSVNGAMSQNKLIEFPAELGNPALGGNYVSGAFLRGEGKSYYNLYLFKYAGVNPENGNEQFWKQVKDADGNVTGNEITENFAEASQYEIGDAMPDIVGGIRTTFQWKGFDLTVAAAYQLGGLQWDGASANLYEPWRPAFAVSDDLAGNTWTPENPNAEFPRTSYNGVWDFGSSKCDALYRKASYFNLKNINVGYTLPKKWTSKVGLQSLRVFFNADNLCFITAHDGFDPRAGYTGTSFVNFPQARTFTFGLTLNL